MAEDLEKIRQELALLRAQIAALTELTQRILRQVEKEDAHTTGIGYGGAEPTG